MDAAFAYIDMLGFSEYVTTDLVGAARVLESQRVTFNTRRDDARHYAKHGTPLSPLAEDHLVTSFDHFLPFSDSIFIASASPDRFLRQLATFLTAAFSYTGHAYSFPEDPAQPEKVSLRVSGLAGEEESEEQKWYPALWRGGLSFGRVELLQSPGVANGQHIDVPLLVGAPVVSAVALEKKSGKGPRLFCDPSFKNHVSDPAVRSCFVPVAGKPCEEFLWPVFLFNDHAHPLASLTQASELLVPAINLWHAKRRSEVEEHYLQFVRLIARSALNWAKQHNVADPGREQLRRQIIAFNGAELVDDVCA